MLGKEAFEKAFKATERDEENDSTVIEVMEDLDLDLDEIKEITIEYINNNFVSLMLQVNDISERANIEAALRSIMCGLFTRGLIIGVSMGKTAYLEEITSD